MRPRRTSSAHVASNLANLRQRYELIPYYYSLAWRAHLFGEPVVPPLVFHHQDDPAVRRIGHEKLIGRDLLVGIVARHGEYARDVYLPAGPLGRLPHATSGSRAPARCSTTCRSTATASSACRPSPAPGRSCR